MIQRKPITPQNALARLESLCSRSEHCEYEMRTKLRTWGVGSSDTDKIIESLKANRFVDDARFARAFVNDKYRFAGHGRMKIRLALVAKRVERPIIEEALAEIDEEIYAARLRDILLAKIRRTADADTYEGRTKIFRFGASRGFEPDLVAAAIRDIFKKQ